ncbi:hypothetical protein GIB67_040047, partial [Kingdonia uniflora]
RISARRFASSEEGEALAVLEGILWDKKRRIPKVYIETDVEAIVTFCRTGGAAISCTSKAILQDCLALFSSFVNIDICYVPRSANIVAHALASRTVGNNYNWSWRAVSNTIISDTNMRIKEHDSPPTIIPTSPIDFDHTPSYCEENVYMLCKKLMKNGVANEDGSDLFVVFISNENNQIPLWHQKSSARADGLVLWDYHLICIQRKKEENTVQVWDLDSNLPLPSPLKQYVSEAIRPSFQLYSGYQRLFRVVHAPVFLCHFASDRRHMKDSDGTWIAQPPPYEPIVAEDGDVHNLNEYIKFSTAEVLNVENDTVDCDFSEKMGVVVREGQFEDFFNRLPC